MIYVCIILRDLIRIFLGLDMLEKWLGESVGQSMHGLPPKTLNYKQPLVPSQQDDTSNAVDENDYLSDKLMSDGSHSAKTSAQNTGSSKHAVVDQGRKILFKKVSNAHPWLSCSLLVPIRKRSPANRGDSCGQASEAALQGQRKARADHQLVQGQGADQATNAQGDRPEGSPGHSIATVQTAENPLHLLVPDKKVVAGAGGRRAVRQGRLFVCGEQQIWQHIAQHHTERCG